LAQAARISFEVLLDQGLNFRDLLWLETEVRGELDGWIDPELRFAVSMLNVNMSSCSSREKK
jgi:hypothetical protein